VSLPEVPHFRSPSDETVQFAVSMPPPGRHAGPHPHRARDALIVACLAVLLVILVIIAGALADVAARLLHL
jgi:hypothetical protein